MSAELCTHCNRVVEPVGPSTGLVVGFAVLIIISFVVILAYSGWVVILGPAIFFVYYVFLRKRCPDCGGKSFGKVVPLRSTKEESTYESPTVQQRALTGGLARGAAANYCSSCGAQLAFDAQFCERCGVPVKGGIPSETDAA